MAPSTILRNGSTERPVDMTTYLFEKHRLIWLNHAIDSEVAAEVISSIMVLDEKNHNDIVMLLDCPGGSISSGMAIIDAMNAASSDIVTVCLGTAASMAAVILAAGTPGKRFASESSSVMIHQPLAGVQGSASDVEILSKRLIETKESLKKYLSVLTGKSPKVIEKHMDRDTWFSASKALEFGLVDHLLDRLPTVINEEGV